MGTSGIPGDFPVVIQPYQAWRSGGCPEFFPHTSENDIPKLTQKPEERSLTGNSYTEPKARSSTENFHAWRHCKGQPSSVQAYLGQVGLLLSGITLVLRQ